MVLGTCRRWRDTDNWWELPLLLPSRPLSPPCWLYLLNADMGEYVMGFWNDKTSIRRFVVYGVECPLVEI